MARQIKRPRSRLVRVRFPTWIQSNLAVEDQNHQDGWRGTGQFSAIVSTASHEGLRKGNKQHKLRLFVRIMVSSVLKKVTSSYLQLDIEAEEYFGGDEEEKKNKLRLYKKNVRLTWRAIHLLNPEKV